MMTITGTSDSKLYNRHWDNDWQRQWLSLTKQKFILAKNGGDEWVNGSTRQRNVGIAIVE